MYNFALPSAVYECSGCSTSFPIFDIGSFKILDNLVDISETSFDFNLHFTDDFYEVSFKIVCSDTVPTIQKTLNKFLLSLY